MKKLFGIAALFAVALILGTWACEPPNGTSNPYMPTNIATNTPTPGGPTATSTPTGASTATPTATIVPPTSTGSGTIAATVVYGGSFNFNPMATTILAGQAVLYDSSLNGHTVDIDNGLGVCYSNTTSFPLTLTFPSKGSFTFHCNYHGSCSSGCASCSAMWGSVQVN